MQMLEEMMALGPYGLVNMTDQGRNRSMQQEVTSGDQSCNRSMQLDLSPHHHNHRPHALIPMFAAMPLWGVVKGCA